MHGLTKWILASSLVACVNRKPEADQTPGASAVPFATPTPPTSAPQAPSANAAAASAPAASPHVDGGARVACTFDLPFAFPSIEQVPSGVLAQAAIPSLDMRHMKAKVVKADGGADVVIDCHGGATPASWEFTEASAKSLPAGTVRILERRPLPDGREAVWIATARDLGACVAEDGFGFFAILALDGKHLNVLGVSPWHPSCGPKRQLRAERLGGETVYIEPDKEGTGAGFDGWENVWTLHDGDLHLAGRYDTLQTGAAESGAQVDDAGLYPPSFTATVHFEGHEIIVQGENTWMKPLGHDAGSGDPWVFAKKGPYLHRYEIKGGALIDESEKPPERGPHKTDKAPSPKRHP